MPATVAINGIIVDPLSSENQTANQTAQSFRDITAQAIQNMDEVLRNRGLGRVTPVFQIPSSLTPVNNRIADLTNPRNPSIQFYVSEGQYYAAVTSADNPSGRLVRFIDPAGNPIDGKKVQEIYNEINRNYSKIKTPFIQELTSALPPEFQHTLSNSIPKEMPKELDTTNVQREGYELV